MKAAVKAELIPALAWGALMLGVAFAAAYAHRLGHIDADTKLRVIAMNGLWMIWYGNRAPKAFAPSACARQAKRVVGWSLVLSGLVYAGMFAFAPIPLALTVGTGAVLAGIAVSIGYCLSLRAMPKAG